MRYSLPLVVSEGDSLRGHFEVDHSGHGWRVGAQSHGGGLLHRLDACQGLHFHGAQVPHVTGCGRTHTNNRLAQLRWRRRDEEGGRFMMFIGDGLITCALFEQLSSRVGD